jgi:hypothetical protein
VATAQVDEELAQFLDAALGILAVVEKPEQAANALAPVTDRSGAVVGGLAVVEPGFAQATQSVGVDPLSDFGTDKP